MTNYRVNIFLDDEHNTLFETVDFKVKHFRLSDGRKISSYGGFTSLFALDKKLVFSSKCRGDEHFSKKKGILTCLQKMLKTKKTFLVIPSTGTDILSALFLDNHADIWIGNATENLQMENWWVQSGAHL